MNKILMKAISLFLALLTAVSVLGVTAFAASNPTLTIEGKYDSSKKTYTVTASITNSSIDVGAAMFVLDYDQALMKTDAKSVTYLNGAIESATYYDQAKGYVGADWYYQPVLGKNSKPTQVVRIVFAVKGNYADMKSSSIKICTDTKYLDDIAGYGVDGGALICDGPNYYNVASKSVNIVYKLDLQEGSKTTTSPTVTTKTTTTKPTTTKTTTAAKLPSDIKATRLAGSDRIATAINISNQGWKKANNVIIANAYSYPDALAGAPLAYKLDAPILLTVGEDSLEKNITDEIKRLGAKNVYILGGNAAVSDKISKSLSSSGYTVKRLSGESRYETAVAIAKQLASLTGKKPSELFFVSGANFPDALAVSSIAALKGCPILYVPAAGSIDKSTADYVSSSGCKKATILGGTAAVSDAGKNSISKLGVTVSRVSGSDRYETALAIYKKYDSVFKGKTIAVATGENFPDALAGGAYAAKLGCPVILVGKKVSSGMKSYVSDMKVKTVYIFGGVNAVSDDTVSKLIAR